MADITGTRFGSLVATSPHHTNGRQWFWTVRCDCGAEKIVRADKLISGRAKSCGCTQHPRAWKIRTPTYRSWIAMIRRCSYPRKYYEGITVCERWQSFSNFLEDMGERPPGKSIDRWPDPYGNYEPGNCRWATGAEQTKNQRKSIT